MNLDVSRICENVLMQQIQRESVFGQQNNPLLGADPFGEEGAWWAGPDLNRRSSPREGDVPWSHQKVNQLDYRPS